MSDFRPRAPRTAISPIVSSHLKDLESWDQAVAASKIRDALGPLKRPEQLRVAAEIQRQLDDDLARRDSVEEIIRWMENLPDSGVVFQRPQGSIFHQLEDALLNKRVYFGKEGNLAGPAPRPTVTIRTAEQIATDPEPAPPSIANATVFIIQHDWSAVLKLSDEVGQEYRLPFPRCAFEMQVSDRRIIAVMTDDGGAITGDLYMKTAKGYWTHAPLLTWERIGNAVKATSIMLETEVAEAQVMRASRDQSVARERAGRPPLRDFHIVRLDHRRRVAAAETPAGVERRSPRLHFRRGHWRHLGNIRTWIKWMLVGNPELGFVDKEYRL